MKALTISQPWAYLIAEGFKRVENRTWATQHRGPIAIHAGNGQQYMKQLPGHLKQRFRREQPFGAVVAVADLIRCIEHDIIWSLVRAKPELFWVDEHQFTEGPVCWILANIRKLKTPWRCSGRQGLFDLDWEPAGEDLLPVHTPLGTFRGTEDFIDAEGSQYREYKKGAGHKGRQNWWP